MASFNVDTIVLNPGPSLTYLTGLHFHLMERPTVFLYQLGAPPALILPELEKGKLETSRIPLTAFPFSDDPSTWQQVFSDAVRRFGLSHTSIGIEPTRLRFLELNFLEIAAPDCTFFAAEGIFENLRIHKEEEEISSMRKAVLIAENALTATLPMIREGTSEEKIASELIIQLYRAGSSSELPFAPIVAAGPNSANPHAVPTRRTLQRGDLLVIDWGAGYEGYCSDLTRTFAIGELSDEFRAIYQTVLQANQAGRCAGRPGIKAGGIDLAARSEIEKNGFGDFFPHRTGHGLGMEGHETPYLFSANPQLLEKGMVYTVEPGIYFPGKGGVRIEDDIVITENGSESLSNYSRELQILG